MPRDDSTVTVTTDTADRPDRGGGLRGSVYAVALLCYVSILFARR